MENKEIREDICWRIAKCFNIDYAEEPIITYSSAKLEKIIRELISRVEKEDVERGRKQLIRELSKHNHIGRPKEVVEKVIRLNKEGLTLREIGVKIGCSYETVRQILKELKELVS